ncbi:MAG: tetratricopeptide repeat protein [Polyangia bacterium]
MRLAPVMGAVVALVALGAVASAAPAHGRARQALEQAARGDAWLVAGNCDEAVKSYERAIALDPRAGLVKVHLAHCLARTGAQASAHALLIEVSKSPPPVGPAALVELGDQAMAAGDLATAVAVYGELVDHAPGDVEAKVALLDALKALSDKGDANARARAVLLADQLKIDPRADQATQKHVEELAGYLRYGDAGHDVLEGKDRLAAGDARGAIVSLERAVKAHPELEEAEYLLGLAYATPSIGRKDDARRALRKAPHIKEANYALGVEAYEGDDLDEAGKRFAQAIALDDRYQAAHYQLGLVDRERGDVKGAEREWQRAIHIDPKSELGRWAATKLSMTTGNVNALAEGQVIDPSSEIGIGIKISEQVQERFGRMNDPALEERLNKILHRLAKVSDRPERELRYQVVLVDVPMINALTLPGGTVLVFRGLVDMMNKTMGGSDDAWAAVLGHECAHAALRHGMGMIQVASSLALDRPFAGGAGDLAAFFNTISRAHEFEADQFGALYAYRAGFNPSAALVLHKKMLETMGEIPRGMTHPTQAERIARVRDYLLDLRAKVHGFDLAVKSLGSGDYDAAIGRFEVFLGVFPDSTAARSNLGVALHRKALTALVPSTRFRRSTDIDPNSRARKIELHAGAPQVAGLKKEAEIDQRLLRQAIDEYRATLEVDPSYAKAQINLGAALDDLKDRRGARAALERAVRMAPKEKEGWNDLGAVAAETGDTARALGALDKAVALDGNYPEAWFNLAMTYEQASRNKDAAAAWTKYLGLDGKSGWSNIAREHIARMKK